VRAQARRDSEAESRGLTSVFFLRLATEAAMRKATLARIHWVSCIRHDGAIVLTEADRHGERAVISLP